MEPTIVTKDEVVLVGVIADASDICGLWGAFGAVEPRIPNTVQGTWYEVHTHPENYRQGEPWEVMVGVQVTGIDALPEGATIKRLPAGQYARFAHRLGNGGYSGLNPTMDNWLKTGPFRQLGSCCIQVIDSRFKGPDNPDSEIDFLIPVEPR